MVHSRLRAAIGSLVSELTHLRELLAARRRGEADVLRTPSVQASWKAGTRTSPAAVPDGDMMAETL